MIMTKKTSYLIGLAVALAVTALSFILLERWQAFCFFYREQNQIFLFDWKDVVSKILSPGGVSVVLSQFLVQFFKVPHVGTLVTVLLGLGCLLLLWETLKGKDVPVAAVPLCLIPVFLQEGALADTFYSYHGFVSFFLAILLLWIHARFISAKKVPRRTLWEMLSVVLLYLAAGPAAFLLAVCIAVIDISSSKKDWYLALFPTVAVLLCGLVSVRTGVLQSIRFAIFQDGYYEPLLKPDWYIHASWVALPLVLAAGLGSRAIKGWPLKAALASTAVVLSLVVLYRIPGHINKKYNDSLRLTYYVNQGDWDSILKDPTAKHMNYIMMSVRNLALSHKGLLLDKLFDYPQKGYLSLLVDDDQSSLNPDIISFDSHIYYQMGNVGASMNKAFDANVGTKYGNPAMVMKLIRTNLVWGAWDVAGKNIALMEKTWAYREEAQGFRRFLRNDEAILSDPELGRLRRCIQDTDSFVGMDIHGDLLEILRTNPDDKAVREYYVALLLLAKDIEGLRAYIENDPGAYGPDGSLHPLLQEVIKIYAENDEAYCREHGVTDETFKRYDSFKKRFIQAGNKGGNPVRDMKSFSGTFWYYYMFTEI